MDLHRTALLTDLYELTMLQAYYEHRMSERATFEFFVRDLPASRRFLLAAGLEQLLDFLESFRFGVEEIDHLRKDSRFTPSFLDYLATLRFDGDVHALPEGTVFFQNEPVVRVTAPLPVAQVIESRLINIVHLQTLVASKAARCVIAAMGKELVDFGMRRAHGAEASLYAARAAYIAGMDGTATVIAGTLFDIPLYGTMAHSFIQAHEDETTAFRHFALSQPDNVVLLIDTYDTALGARRVAELVPELRDRGISVHAVRIDSGDLGESARVVRAILDDAGCGDIRIVASGNLDEFELAALAAAKVPIDSFGVGTHLDTSADCPYLDCAYKLEAYAGMATRKLSRGKATWPGPKQVYRLFDTAGRVHEDVLTTAADHRAGLPLLEPVMQGGRRIASPESLDTIRARAGENLAALSDPLRSLSHEPFEFPVTVSDELEALAREVDARVASKAGPLSRVEFN